MNPAIRTIESVREGARFERRRVMDSPTQAPGATRSSLEDRSEIAEWLEIVGLIVLRCFYRIQTAGVENLPVRGGTLLAGNHVTWVDAAMLVGASPRPVRFLVARSMFDVPFLGWFIRQFRAVPIAPRQAKDAVRTTVEEIVSGSAVCLFPEGQLSRSGMMGPFQPGAGLIARRIGDAPVVPFHIDGMWGSVFSYSEGRFFWKAPGKLRRRVIVSFGRPLRERSGDLEELRSTVVACAWAACRRRAAEEPDLWRRLRLAWNRREAWIAERSGEQARCWTGPDLLEAAAEIESRLGWLTRGTAVAVCGDPCMNTAAAHLALVRRGCAPVSLSESAGRDEHCWAGFLDAAGVAAAGRLDGAGWNWERCKREARRRIPEAGAVALAVFRQEGWTVHRFDSVSLAAGVIQLRETLAFKRTDRVWCPRTFSRPGVWWAGWWLPLLQGLPMVCGSGGEVRDAGRFQPTLAVADRERLAEWGKGGECAWMPPTVLHFESRIPGAEEGVQWAAERRCMLRGLDDPVSGCVLALSTPDPPDWQARGLYPGCRAGSAGRLLAGVDAGPARHKGDAAEPLRVISPAWSKTAPGTPAEIGLCGRIDADGFVFAEECG